LGRDPRKREGPLKLGFWVGFPSLDTIETPTPTKRLLLIL
jgi:hypothetical protein